VIKYSKEEFCEVDGYRCLMPIEYELVEQKTTGSTYRKVKCNCHNVIDGKCDKSTTCSHYMTAVDVIIE